MKYMHFGLSLKFSIYLHVRTCKLGVVCQVLNGYIQLVTTTCTQSSKYLKQKIEIKPDLVIHACNPGICGAETADL
jgi:hypothetical protein